MTIPTDKYFVEYVMCRRIDCESITVIGLRNVGMKAGWGVTAVGKKAQQESPKWARYRMIKATTQSEEAVNNQNGIVLMRVRSKTNEGIGQTACVTRGNRFKHGNVVESGKCSWRKGQLE